jgi:hypothetical protein
VPAQWVVDFGVGAFCGSGLVGSIWLIVDADRRWRLALDRLNDAHEKVFEAGADLINCLADIPNAFARSLHEAAHQMSRNLAATQALYALRDQLGPTPERGHYALCSELAKVALDAADAVPERHTAEAA